MVDFGGVSVKELTQDTKDGVLDSAVLRKKAASATNPLATVDEASHSPQQDQILTGRAGAVAGHRAKYFDVAVAALEVTLKASTAIPFSAIISGVRLTLTADVLLTLPANSNNFIWIDSTGTLGASTLPCAYMWGAPGAPATDQHYFDLRLAHMYRYNGSSWVAVDRIFLGYARTGASVPNTNPACEPMCLTPMERHRKFGDGGGAAGFSEITGTSTINGVLKVCGMVIRGTGKLKHTANGAPLVIYSTGPVILLGTAMIDLNGLGRPRGEGGITQTGQDGSGGCTGGSGGGGGGNGTGKSGGKGGDHLTRNNIVPSDGGVAGTGDGGDGSQTDAVFAGPVPVLFSFGNGGGSGGGETPGNEGNGGAGGGAIIIFAPCIVAEFGTVLQAEGDDGTVGFGNEGGGGGGGGGMVQIFSPNYFFDTDTLSVVTTQGGTGAAGNGTGGTGGDGGNGNYNTSFY